MGGLSILDRISGTGLTSGVSNEDRVDAVQLVTAYLQAGILFAKINFIPALNDYLQ